MFYSGLESIVGLNCGLQSVVEMNIDVKQVAMQHASLLFNCSCCCNGMVGTSSMDV